jgi:RNA polymerase sigma-70 factor (ECF subfamily)
MTTPPAKPPLGQTQTDWALLHLAHAAIPDQARNVWTQVVLRYEEPVRGSLRRLVRDEQVAEELNQEFWVRFLRGDFAHATPTRGRFRNLIKTVLIHLVADYYRRGRRDRPAPLADDGFVLVGRIANAHAADWRQELIDRALSALGAEAGRSKQVCPEVLAIEVELADRSPAEKAVGLSARVGREVTRENYRQILHRTRARFADLLVAEVRKSLTDPTPEAIREELAELNLLRYCDVPDADEE